MTFAQRRAALQQPVPSSLLRPAMSRGLPYHAASPIHYTEAEIRQATLGHYQPSANARQLFAHLKVPPPSRHWSVYRAEFVYDSYGPIYNLGSNPDLERHYATLFQIDEAQYWISPPIVANIKTAQQYDTSNRSRQDYSNALEQHDQQPQVFNEKPKTAARRRPSIQSAKNSNAPAPSPSALATPSRQAPRRAPPSINTTKASNVGHHFPAEQHSFLVPSMRPIVVENTLPRSVPPPKSMIHKRQLGTDALILRRIASYLDESDCTKMARSCRPLYEILDFAWWASVYPEAIKDDLGNAALSWPCSSGWCDSCELYNATLIVHEISKARLCPRCIELPELQDIKASDAKQLYKLTGKPALALLKMIPFTLVKKCKMWWTPHIQWVQENTDEDYLLRETGPLVQRRRELSSVNVLQDYINSRKTKKRGIRIVNFGSTNRSSDLSEPPTSSTLEHQSPPNGYHSASYICTSGDADEANASTQAQKRPRIQENHMDLQSEQYNALHNIYIGPSSDDIAREVRYDYLKNEAINAGIRMPEWGIPLTGTLLHFVNGEWEEVAKQGIGMNDFKGMIRHIQVGSF